MAIPWLLIGYAFCAAVLVLLSAGCVPRPLVLEGTLECVGPPQDDEVHFICRIQMREPSTSE